MPRTKELNSNKQHAEQTSLQTPESLERQKATLLRNELIAGNCDIAKRVMDTGKLKNFSKGDSIITQGLTDDCVYFILSGDASVQINSRHIDSRSAPFTVGEMATKKPGEARTADVIVSSIKLETLVMSGTEFRKLIQSFPTFAENLENSIDTLSRKKITQLGETIKTKGVPWWAISAITGGVVYASTTLVTWLASLSTLHILFTSIPFGLLAFVCMLLLNPELRYRNLASMAGYALIASTIYGSISFFLTIDGKKVELPLINFSVHTEQKLGLFVVGSIALLLLTFLSGILDLKLGGSQK